MTIKRGVFLVVLLFAFLAGTLVSPVLSKGTTPKYLRVDYMKVRPGMGESYLEMERNLWRPVHQLRRASGQISDWGVWGVQFPGETVGYDYVTLTAYRRWELLEDYGHPRLFNKIQPDKTYEQIRKITDDNRVLVRSEVWVQMEGLD